MESGSTNVSVTGITGYKYANDPIATDITDWENGTVANYTLSGTGVANIDQGDEDHAVNVPSTGPGYYLLKADVNGAFKYSNSFGPFTELTGTSLSQTYIKNVQLTQGTYAIYQYSYSNSATTNTRIAIASGDNVNNGYIEIAAGDVAYYNVWFNTSSRVVTLEDPLDPTDVHSYTTPLFKADVDEGGLDLSESPKTLDIPSRENKMPGQGPKKAISDAPRIFMIHNAVDWWGATQFIYVWNSNTNAKWKGQMTAGANNYCYVDLPAGSWTNALFYRAPSKDEDWWNQTVDLTLTSGNNVFTLSNDEVGGKKTGSWSAGSFFQGGVTYYLKANSNWKADGARFAINLCLGPSSETWADCAQVGTSDYYSVTLPVGYWNTMIFCRMNGGTSANNWDNRWNQTGDLSKPSDSNRLFTLPDTITSGGSWGSHQVTLTPSAGSNGSISPNSAQTVNIGSSVTFTAAPNTGFDFSTWSGKSSATTRSITISDITPADGGTYTASFTAHNYSIDYVVWQNGKTGPTAGNVSHNNPDTYAYTTTTTNVDLLDASDTTGTYAFKGWYSDASLESQVTSFNKNSTSGYTFYAKWAETWTVSYNKNGGSGDDNTSAEVPKTESVTLPAADLFTAPSGYEFAYWCVNSNGSGTQYAAGASYTPTANTTIYAQWKRTITLHRNDGTNATTTLTHIRSIDQNNIDGPSSRTGYTFSAWKNSAGDATYNAITTDTPADLYASWTAKYYDITLNDNGATTAGTAKIYERYDNCYYKTKSVGGTYSDVMGTSANPITIPQKTGYTFGGYYLTNDGTWYSSDQYISASGYLTSNAVNNHFSADGNLYAKWTANTYEVKFNGNGAASGTMSNESFTYDADAKALTACAFNPPTNDYLFAGWALSEHGAVEYDDGDSVSNLTSTANGVVNLYAKWSRSITLNRNGGSGGDGSITHYYNDSVSSLSITTAPSYSGWDFDGYYTTPYSGGTQIYNGNRAGQSVTWGSTYNSQSQLYARWKRTINFDGNGGTVLPATAIHYLNVPIAIESSPYPSSYSRTGYRFDHWKDSSGNTITSIDNDTPTTLYAQWEGNTYEVTLNLQSGTATQTTVSAKYGDPMPEIPSANLPTKSGVTFLGYYESNNGGGTPYYHADGTSANVWNIASNTTIYAYWGRVYYLYDKGNSLDGEPHAYAWVAGTNPLTEKAVWPGESMTKVHTDLNGNAAPDHTEDNNDPCRVYRIILPEQFNRLIFSATNQTTDIVISANQSGKIYAIEGSFNISEGTRYYGGWYDSFPSSVTYRIKLYDDQQNFSTDSYDGNGDFNGNVPYAYAFAAETGDSGSQNKEDWWIVGSGSFLQNGDTPFSTSTGTQLSELTNYNGWVQYMKFERGDKFKITNGTIWHGYNGGNGLTTTLSGYFSDVDGDNHNIYVEVSGWYTVKLNNGTISIEYATFPVCPNANGAWEDVNTLIAGIWEKQYTFTFQVSESYNYVIFRNAAADKQTVNIDQPSLDSQIYFVLDGNAEGGKYTGNWYEEPYSIAINIVLFTSDGTPFTIDGNSVISTGKHDTSFATVSYVPTSAMVSGLSIDDYYNLVNLVDYIWHYFKWNGTFYTDPACTTSYASGSPASTIHATGLYLKYICDTSKLKTFYFDVSAVSWTPHIDAWFTTSAVHMSGSTHNDVKDLGGGLYRFTLPTDDGTNSMNFILNNGYTTGVNQTSDITTFATESAYKMPYISVKATTGAYDNRNSNWCHPKTYDHYGTLVKFDSTGAFSALYEMYSTDAANKLYVYDFGVEFAANEYFTIIFDDKTDSPFGCNTANVDLNAAYSYTGSSSSGTTASITYNIDGHVASGVPSERYQFTVAGKYAFYYLNNDRIAVSAMPTNGNGYYLVPGDDTEVFTNGFRMRTINASVNLATYTCLDVAAGDKYFIASYIDGAKEQYVDVKSSYSSASDFTITTNVTMGYTESEGVYTPTGVITFGVKGTYNVFLYKSGGKTLISVSETNSSDFFKLNRVDVNNSDVKSQKTSFVIEIAFTANNTHDVSIGISSSSAGTVAPCLRYSATIVAAGSRRASPWDYMRTNKYGNGDFSALGTAKADLITISANTAATYYAYILIDYDPGKLNDFAELDSYTTGYALNFTIEQEVA